MFKGEDFLDFLELNQTKLERTFCNTRLVLYRNSDSNKPLKMISQQQYQESERERDCVNGDEDAEWSDWTEETGDRIVCLLCPLSVTSWEDINSHLIVEHDIHYEQLTASLDFYQQVSRWTCYNHAVNDFSFIVTVEYILFKLLIKEVSLRLFYK